MVGETVKGYEIDELIDEGGMSIVYLGVHKKLGRKAALKMLNPALENNALIKARFHEEAKLLSTVSHPNILAIYDYVENKHGSFIITEFIKGETLENYIDLVSGPIPETRAVKLMLKMLSALAHIHSKDIIHRDIKPSNFIITPDSEIKLIDFGIAKNLTTSGHLNTKSGTKVGTTFYMSPQQVKGQVLDRRSDIYSLGVTFFQMLTGQYPYDKDEAEYDIYNKIVKEPLPSAQSFYKGVSDRMEEIIARATQKKPMARFQSCEEFSMALMSTQEKPVKTENLSLKTRIIEAADVDIKGKIFTKIFWQNLIMILTAVSFLTIIGFGIFFISKKNVRHIIENNQALYTSNSYDSKVIESLNYGETVKVIKAGNESEKEWLKIQSLRGYVGYIPVKFTANTHIYKQINSILANSTAREVVPVKYKLALRRYFSDNNMLEKNYAKWTLSAEKNKDFEYNSVVNGELNNNNANDFCCIISENNKNNNRLLIFFDNVQDVIAVEPGEPSKIKIIQKGKAGGRWFLGNMIEKEKRNGEKYKVKKYEYLQENAILLLKQDSKKIILYIYNVEEKMLETYPQTEVVQ